YNDLYIRSTVAVDSFSVRVTVNSSNCIYDITDKLTGVTATKVDHYTWDIYSTSDFDTLEAGGSLIKICRVEEGHKDGCGGTPHLVTMGFALSTPKMWDTLGTEHFVALDVTSSQARCGVAILPCGDCMGSPPRKQSDEPNLPKEFALHQNYPNPFNPTTTISFDLPIATDYKLIIYNVLGQEVKSFAGHGQAGTVNVDWDANDYSSGLYFYKLEAGDFTDKKKMLLIK
ncbi:T9SS type A sorting domain-containing protein, partial [PVC group bacterium]|nr:T9SS type A sorting domain-containing protein [PVC group bacterium]